MPLFGAIIDMFGNKVVNLGTPTNPQDATTKAYVDSLTVPSAQVPIGAVTMYGGLTAPSGWLTCDGSPVSRTTYATLFASICILNVGITTTSGSPTVGVVTGTSAIPVGSFIAADGSSVIPAGATVTAKTASTLTISANAASSGGFVATISPFGIGNGSTTFNLPDMRRRFPFGALTGNRDVGASDGVVDATTRTTFHRHTIPGQATDPSPLAGGSGTGQPVRNNFFTGHDHGGQSGNNLSMTNPDATMSFPNLTLNFIIRAT